MRRLHKPSARKRARAYLVDVHCRPVAAVANYFGLFGKDMLALPRVEGGRRQFFGQARLIARLGLDVRADLEAAGLPPEFLDRLAPAVDVVNQLDRSALTPARRKAS